MNSRCSCWKKLFNYRQSNGGQSADVLFALLEIDRHLSLYVGILDYRSSLIHHLSQDERQTRLELVEYQTTLPGASAGVSFEFCTDLFTGLTQLIEKKEKGFTPLSELLLNQQFEMTPKEKIKAAQKIVQEIHPSDDLTEMNRRVEFKQKVAESLQEKRKSTWKKSLRKSMSMILQRCLKRRRSCRTAVWISSGWS